jgi:hypothetical protein
VGICKYSDYQALPVLLLVLVVPVLSKSTSPAPTGTCTTNFGNMYSGVLPVNLSTNSTTGRIIYYQYGVRSTPEYVVVLVEEYFQVLRILYI